LKAREKGQEMRPGAGPLRECMQIAIIGAGNVGKTLGTALRAKGHGIAYGVRQPNSSPDRSVGDAIRGGIRETQEMLDFCTRHDIAADVEVIPIDKVNEACGACSRTKCPIASSSTSPA
jgi:D-arabinose 1-dehydrogenase-like Zn-dependent alcohol dehydrogenase